MEALEAFEVAIEEGILVVPLDLEGKDPLVRTECFYMIDLMRQRCDYAFVSLLLPTY